jgi:hypothetical protein
MDVIYMPIAHRTLALARNTYSTLAGFGAEGNFMTAINELIIFSENIF